MLNPSFQRTAVFVSYSPPKTRKESKLPLATFGVGVRSTAKKQRDKTVVDFTLDSKNPHLERGLTVKDRNPTLT